MARMITILLVALVFEAIGVVCLSRGIKELGEMNAISVKEVSRILRDGVTNPNILAGVFFEALFFGGLLILLSKGDVSFVWPLTSLSFVMTAVAAKFFLHEQIAPARWLGICLIMLGAALITWSEKQKSASTTRLGIEASGTGRPPE